MTHWQNSSKQHLTATPQSKSSHGGLRDQSLLGNTEMQHTSAMWTTSGNWQDIRKKGNEYNIIIDRIHYTQTSCPPDFNLAPLHCTMCTLFHTNCAGLLKLWHILKNPKKYFYEHIFFPALTTRRKMEKSKFLWFSNSKYAIFCDFPVIFPDFECSKNNVSSARK